MTLIDLLIILVWLGLGTVGAAIGGSRWGLVGGLAGGVLGVALYFGFAGIFVGIHKLLLRGRPLLPACRNGKCQYRDYKVIARRDEGRVLQCGCGDQYVQVILAGREDLKFINAQGEAVPYMGFEGFGPWRPPSPDPD